MQHFRKIAAGGLSRLVIIACLAISAMPVVAEGKKGRPADNLLRENLVADYPLATLKHFTIVPGSVSFVEENSILALFESPVDGLYAIVVFVANCSSEVCIVEDVAAYVFDAGQAGLSDVERNVSSI